jgi:SAM-dependent methyltransferase
MPVDVLHPSAAEAAEAWAWAVRANAAQVAHVREDLDGGDHYAPVAALFRADPDRTGDPTLDLVRSLVVAGETWLDIGAGAGRYALPLARCAQEVIAVDASRAMVERLRAAAAEHGIDNLRVVEGRWPAAGPIPADVAFISHVGYDIEDIGAFLGGMEASARRLCVAVLLERPPPHPYDVLWPEIHGLTRAPLPALPEFLSLLLARGQLFEVRFTERWAAAFDSLDDVLTLARRQLFVRPGSAKDARLQRLVAARARRDERGYSLATRGGRARLGVVTWTPQPTPRA